MILITPLISFIRSVMNRVLLGPSPIIIVRVEKTRYNKRYISSSYGSYSSTFTGELSTVLARYTHMGREER